MVLESDLTISRLTNSPTGNNSDNVLAALERAAHICSRPAGFSHLELYNCLPSPEQTRISFTCGWYAKIPAMVKMSSALVVFERVNEMPLLRERWNVSVSSSRRRAASISNCIHGTEMVRFSCASNGLRLNFPPLKESNLIKA